MKINLAIVDDHPFMLDGMKLGLNVFSDLNVIISCASAEELLMVLKTIKIRPDVVIIDFLMPDMDGLSLCKILTEKYPDIKIIVNSFQSDQFLVQRAFLHGAVGFLAKEDPPKEIHDAILTVHHGGVYDKKLIRKDILRSIKLGIGVNTKFKIDAKITEREKEVIIYICEGLTYKEIANKMNLSKRTIESHKEKVFEKLGVSKINDIIIYASKMGWV